VWQQHQVVVADHRNPAITFLRYTPVRIETETPADLLKDIDQLRDTLDEVGETDLIKRADILHSITQKILTYLRISKNKDPRDSSFLLSIGVSNVYEELDITAKLGQDRVETLHLFASTMWARFQTGGDPKHLEQAIAYYQKALLLDNRHVECMADLATAFWTRFTRGSHRIQDLDEVVVLYRTILFHAVPGNSKTIEWLNGLGLALWERYKMTKSIADMEHAIFYFRRASISYPTPCDPFTLSNLGNILMAKARAFKDSNEADEAISHYRRALNSVTPLHPHRSAFLSNLGDALAYRYDRRSLMPDLNEAIRCYGRALDLPPPHHRDRVTSLLFYADKLQLRYHRTGEREDLELAVKQYQEAKGLATPGHPKYAIVVESLVLAQRELERTFRGRELEFTSSPPSSHVSPTLDHSQVPLLRPTHWPSPGREREREREVGREREGGVRGESPYRTVPKFRIVSRSNTLKPYSRPQRHTSSASDSESSNHSHSFGNGAPQPPPHSAPMAHLHHPSHSGHDHRNGVGRSSPTMRAKSPIGSHHYSSHRSTVSALREPRRHQTMPSPLPQPR